jgi:hypothetical protein
MGALKCLGLVMPRGQPLSIDTVMGMKLCQVENITRQISQALAGLICNAHRPF